MSIGADRVLYSLAFWTRNGDESSAEALLESLSPAERTEVLATFETPGVARTLFDLDGDELAGRMLNLAGKMEARMGGQWQPKPAEASTILGGSVAEGGTIVIRDHDAWRQQVADERRAKQDEQIRATLAEIERGQNARSLAPPPGREELAAAMRANAALYRERMEAPHRVARQLDVTEALLEAAKAAEPPDPAQLMRYGRPVSSAQLHYEAQQLAAFAARLP